MRMRLQLQCCLLVHISPAPDALPQLRATRSYGRGSGQVRATPSQWNAMRVALGPLVPDRGVAELLRKYGDNTKAAVDDYYGH